MINHLLGRRDHPTRTTRNDTKPYAAQHKGDAVGGGVSEGHAWKAEAAASGGNDSAPSELIEQVVAQVVSGWRASAKPNDLAQLSQDRPMIPNELDRALLLDLSSRIGDYYLEDSVRHDLRRGLLGGGRSARLIRH